MKLYNHYFLLVLLTLISIQSCRSKSVVSETSQRAISLAESHLTLQDTLILWLPQTVTSLSTSYVQNLSEVSPRFASEPAAPTSHHITMIPAAALTRSAAAEEATRTHARAETQISQQKDFTTPAATCKLTGWKFVASSLVVLSLIIVLLRSDKTLTER